MTKFLNAHGNAAMISTAASPILGMDDAVISRNPDLQAQINDFKVQGPAVTNKYTAQNFLPEKIVSPHPRFIGLAASIYQRRGEKVNI